MGTTSITRMTENGEVIEILDCTQSEFDQIISCFGKGERFEKKLISINDSFARAQSAVFPEEELKEENFNRVDTDGFEKAVVMFRFWSEMIQNAMFKNKKFRIEINYNAEMKKTDFAIYTPMEDGKENDYINNGNKEILRRHLEENTYDNTFLVMPDDEEKSMIITPSISGTTLKLSIKRAELLAKIIQDQIQEWK